MIVPPILLLLAALLVVAASALEVAAFVLPYSHVEELRSQGRRGARSLAELRARPAALLAALWTLRVAGATAGALAAWTLAGTLSGGAFGAKLLGAALAILLAVLAEFAGKTLGQRGCNWSSGWRGRCGYSLRV